MAVDQTSAIVRAVEVTYGSVHDCRAFDTLVPETDQTKAVYADKAYDDTERRKELRSRGVFARILHKAVTQQGTHRPAAPREPAPVQAARRC